MRGLIAIVALLLPLVAGVVLTDVGSRMVFGLGLVGLVDALAGRGIGDDWVGIGGAWFLAFFGLLGAGALLSIVWSNSALIGNDVVPHVFLGADLMGHSRYVPQDDLQAPVVVVPPISPSSGGPSYGFSAIYRRHLLIADGAGGWQRLLELSTTNLIWPVIAAPVVFAVGQVLAWGPLVIARDHGIAVLAERAGAAQPLPLLLFGELGLWVALAVVVVAAVLVPLALRTGRWTRAVYARLEQPRQGGYPLARPLPDTVRTGGTVQGRIIDSGRRAVGKERKRTDRLYLVEFAGPFDPAVWVGLRFRERRKRRDFIAYLEERQASGLPVSFDVIGAGDLQIVPRDAAGGPAPDGIAEDVRAF